MRLVFAGTPDFAATVLEGLVAAGHDLCAVYCQPDRPAGRGRRSRPGPVAALAAERGLVLHQPRSLRDPVVTQALHELAPQAMVVAAYGLILPPAVLRAPRCGCINVHASLLPRWRGAAPIQRAILAGDAETGVCIMRMEEGLDTGAVLARRRTPIAPDDTAGSLHDRLAELGTQALLEVLQRLPDALAAAEAQDDALATYAPRIEKEETRVAWSEDAAAVVRRIHAFSPAPGAWTSLPPRSRHDPRLRLLRAACEASRPSAPATPGTVVEAASGRVVVACGSGAVRLLEVQPSGARAMSAAAFLNAGRLRAGDLLR
jgi:methionyl-tRNA formyltransferase